MTEATDDRSEPSDSPCDVDCYCQLNGLMDLLSRRYAMQLICVVGAIGPARYGEIEDTFESVSSSTLSSRLDDLVDAGYLSREQYAEIPPRVEYDLTDAGEELCRRLQPLLEWAADRDV
ncbi:helix-turn-helix transcriptional regulator [Natrinema sp. S1CR25-10]|uniref:Helix-turn-helix transcriptional regulator n=2 Tax=Natrinema salsiterrestre TaxID=2950540 RepID=A0A9Q4L528_9EURY|nr:helix-turn-helix domain-containing protein [Natrinema salsiterrestre]MDF9747729.1 helix-turn-helix transcriptional regulator [Natrinema salsiterrestre]